MSDYTIELSSEAINGSMNYKRKFNMSGDIGGGGGGVLVVTEVNNEALDKTWQQINDADFPVFKIGDEYGTNWERIITSYNDDDDGKYDVYAGESMHFKADTANDYPILPDPAL